MTKRAIVLVHGYMGCSAQFNDLIPFIRNVDAEIIRFVLPGHETSLDQYLESGWKDWKSSVTELLDRLRAQYESILLVGHSMGGLLSICAAVESSEKIQAIVSIAMPIYLKMSFSGMKMRIMTLFPPKGSENEQISAARNCCGVSGLTLFNSIRLLPNTIGLLKIIRHTKRSLEMLSVPLVLIYSTSDEIISWKSSRFIKSRFPSAELVRLNKSGHFWFSKEETAKIASVIIDLANKRGCPENS
jgi:carboxylesterase